MSSTQDLVSVRPVRRGAVSPVAVAGVLAFVAMFDMGVANLAVAPVASDLGAELSAAQGILLGYQIPLTLLLLPAGRLVDRRGAFPVLRWALPGFVVASIAVALAPGIGWLIGARGVQGAFAAVLFVLMPVLVRAGGGVSARAMSVPATAGPLGGLLGPSVGGLVVQNLGWRWVFVVAVPLCLIAVPALRRNVPEPAGFRERRPIATVLRTGRAGGVYVAVVALGAAFAGSHLTTALWLQIDHGVGPALSGLVLLAFPAAMTVVGLPAGRLADRRGPGRTAVEGAAVTAAGLALVALVITLELPVPLVVPALVLAGLGTGLYGGPAQALVMRLAPPGTAGTAGALVQLARSAGFAAGPALAVPGQRTFTLITTTALAAVATLSLTLPGRPGNPE